ncbi:MAG TPA: hypothetical protein VMM36_13485 [Opitutaceae bacterium]|nr:hypothetical protein [Opitutaceae bacterium]
MHWSFLSRSPNLEEHGSEPECPAPLAPPLNEPVAYFAAVVRGEIPVHPLSSLETNMIVTQILYAARESARTGQSVDLPTR